MNKIHRNYGTLIGPIEDKMIRSIWRVVRDPDDAEEAFQEALATIWKRLDKIGRHPNPHALILRICINAAYDVLHRKIRRRWREELKAIPTEIPDPRPSPAERLSGQEERAEIIRAIRQLPRKQADAALMRFVQELSYQEIAQALGCSEVTVRTHIARARTRLAKLLAHLAPHSPKEAMNG
ncbi:MAG: RNA polymerase sigma factor [Planctomycetota bacterium]